MRPVLQIQPRRPLLDTTQQEVPHRIEADHAHPQSVFDGAADYFECEGFQQSQHLDVLAAARLAESCLQQAPQREEAVRQLPAYQRSSLVKRPCLLLQKPQIVQRIEDHRLMLISAGIGTMKFRRV